MAKPIRLTEKLIADMTKEFEESLKRAKMSDGKITYTKAFTYPGQSDIKADVWFLPSAYLKMLTLLQDFESEVAWHGVVERTGDTEFVITDIIVYPQEVTGATVNTDQEAYQRWLMGLDDEVANHLHMQGHSHVRMGTSPSVTDVTHQEQIIAQLTDDMFYIFMIWNKRLEHTIKVFDNKFNTLYEDADVNVGVICEDFSLDDFISEAKATVKPKAIQSAKSANNVSSYPGAYGGSAYGGSAYGGSAYGGYGSSYGSGYSSESRRAGFQSEDKPAASGKGKGSGAKNKSACPQNSAYDQVDFDEYVFGELERRGMIPT